MKLFFFFPLGVRIFLVRIFWSGEHSTFVIRDTHLFLWTSSGIIKYKCTLNDLEFDTLIISDGFLLVRVQLPRPVRT